MGDEKQVETLRIFSENKIRKIMAAIIFCKEVLKYGRHHSF